MAECRQIIFECGANQSTFLCNYCAFLLCSLTWDEMQLTKYGALNSHPRTARISSRSLMDISRGVG